MLAVGALADGGTDDVVGVTTDAAAGSEVVTAAALGSPSGVRELLSETTTTLVEATGATTATTATAPTTPTTQRVAATVPPTSTTVEAAAAEDEAEPTTTTQPLKPRALTTERSEAQASPTTTEAPEREATTATTTPPRRAPSTTTTTTTAPPPSSGSSEGYAYDDPRSTQVWYDLAQCESGGNWSIDTGNGYYGGLQFSLPTWESVGGTGYPDEHPAATQIEFGRKLQARQGWGAWPHCSEKLGLR